MNGRPQGEIVSDGVQPGSKEYNFFCDALALYDTVMFSKQRGLNKKFQEKVKLLVKSDPFLTKIADWSGINLYTDPARSLPNGYQGYEAALEILIPKLCDVEDNERHERTCCRKAKKLLDDAKGIIQYRRNYGNNTGKSLDENHKNVIELWERLMKGRKP